MIDLAGFTESKDIGNRIWYSLNFTQEDVLRLGRTFDLEDDYGIHLYDIILQWIGPKKTFYLNQPSYILDFLNYSDDLTRQTIVIISWLVFSMVLFYLFCNKFVKSMKA